MVVRNKKFQDFENIVYSYYQKYARDLPWRKSINPYRILVSEVMLQQTQVNRVSPKYKSFLKCFPTFTKLAEASQGDVLTNWQGLGYNRRALALQKIARIVKQKYNGRLPQDIDILKSLPGIGCTTACSITTFAYNTPTVFVETNIRGVYIHHFFQGKRVLPTHICETSL